MKTAHQIALLSVCMIVSIGCRRTERSDLFNRSDRSAAESHSNSNSSSSSNATRSMNRAAERRAAEELAGQLNLKATSPVQNRLIQALGIYLSESGFLEGAPRDLMIDRRGSAHIISLVSKDQYDEEIFKDFASELSREVFKGGPVDIHLCRDANFRSNAIITAHDLGSLKRFGSLALYYTEGVTPKRVAQLGARLKRAGLASGAPVGAQLTRGEGGAYQVKLVIRDGLKIEQHDEAFQSAHAALKRALFKGDSFELHASDARFKTLKVYR